MSVSIKESAFVVSGGQTVSLSNAITVTPSSSDPTYLVLNGLDRNEYTASATAATGTLSGNGATDHFTAIDNDDGRGVGIVFTYQAAAGRYYSSTYGYLDQLTYTASASVNDVTSLSLFGTNSLSLANSTGKNIYSLAQVDSSGFIGSTTIATQPGFSGPVPAQATPNSIAAVAKSFVGQAWNMDGCWVLASTIAAEAGAGLPVQSTMIGVPGQANGEWLVAYNGPAGTTNTTNWESLVKTGEIVVIENADGSSGHITTCVSGSGSAALLVDNITYETASGKITNAANDGSANDVIIAAPHLASAEFSGVQASSVVIYELDTPIVADLIKSDSIAVGASQVLSLLFSASDPAGKALAAYQIYDTKTSDGLTVGGVLQAAHSAATALTVASLAAIDLTAGTATGTDTLEVRAYNGSYWGDWQSLAVTVATSVAPSPPAVTDPTAVQTWHQGKAVSLTLASDTFSDPNGEALTLTATLANGNALPNWLSFNAATDTFSGTVPTNATGLSIVVKATDTSDLSVSETFSVSVPALAPVVTHPTASQIWTTGQTLSFTLPATTFSDPQGQALTYTAWQESGPTVTSWLHFNATTETFSGTIPTATTSETITLAVEATDTSGLSVWDNFAVTIMHGSVTSKLVGVGGFELGGHATLLS